MAKRDIIVIGASTGGFEAIRKLASDLPANLNAAIFIVWHMSPEATGILPQVLSRSTGLVVKEAEDGEPIEMGRVYVARPDNHLLIAKDTVHVTNGPRENRFRPAIDPLFRSAAYAYGPRVIGVILTGGLDDGTAGLWTVKEFGGTAVVQDPDEAEAPSMPQSALREVKVDYKLTLKEMGNVLEKLVGEEVDETVAVETREKEKTRHEVRIAMQEDIFDEDLMNFGVPTVYTCPECNGVLSEWRDGSFARFRCHTGHAFTSASLLTSITEHIEISFWSAIRRVQESIMLLNHMGDHFAEVNNPAVAAQYFKKAKDAESRVAIMRSAVFGHEQLSPEEIEHQASGENAQPQGK